MTHSIRRIAAVLFCICIIASAFSSSAFPSNTSNPFANFSAVIDLENNDIAVSFTPVRDFSATLLAKYFLSDYPSDNASLALMRRAIQEQQDAIQVLQNLYSASGLEYLEKAFKNRDRYISISGTDVLLCAENWDRIVDDYFAVRYPSIDAGGKAALKAFKYFEPQYGEPTGSAPLLIQVLSAAFGDPSAAARDLDVVIADLSAYYSDMRTFYESAPGEYLAKARADFGNFFTFEVYYLDGSGHEVPLYNYLYGSNIGSYAGALGDIFQAAQNDAKALRSYLTNTAVSFKIHSAVDLEGIADKLRVRFTTDEITTDVPFTEYTVIVIPTLSSQSVSGLTADNTYINSGVLNFSVNPVNLFSGNPQQGSLRLIPVSWGLDGSGAAAFDGSYGGSIDLSGLTLGFHFLTVNSDYQTYSNGIWTDNGVAVPLTVNFYISANLTDIISPDGISAANGTLKSTAALGLPATVKINTTAGVMDAAVTWDLDACAYDPAVKAAQTVPISGIVTLPVNIVNNSNQPLIVQITLTVAADPSPYTSAGLHTGLFTALTLLSGSALLALIYKKRSSSRN